MLILNLLLNVGIALLAYLKKTLTLVGALTACGVGFLFFSIGGWASWLVLILFFLSSTVIHKLKRRWNKTNNQFELEKKGRTGIQVLANSLPALLCLFLFSLTAQPSYYYAMLATLAGATADTWGSEIGILSKHEPISIVTFRKMTSGLSGGITCMGTVASFLGAIFIALFAWCITPKLVVSLSFSHVLWISLLGFLSSIVDSLLGATLQEKFYVAAGEKLLTENISLAERQTNLASGVLGINNNMVNFLSGISIAVLSSLFFIYF